MFTWTLSSATAATTLVLHGMRGVEEMRDNMDRRVGGRRLFYRSARVVEHFGGPLEAMVV